VLTVVVFSPCQHVLQSVKEQTGVEREQQKHQLVLMQNNYTLTNKIH
jgi:hypothetical protein